MKIGGIDIGSRYIKYVILEDDEPVAFYKEDTGGLTGYGKIVF